MLSKSKHLTLAIVVLSFFSFGIAGLAWTAEETLGRRAEPASYLIFLGKTPILHLIDEPGPLTSTATPPPPGTPTTYHPFVTANALYPAEEHQLRELLLQSRSTKEFLSKLRDAGYGVRRE